VSRSFDQCLRGLDRDSANLVRSWKQSMGHHLRRKSDRGVLTCKMTRSERGNSLREQNLDTVPS